MMYVSKTQLAKMIDHTLLKAEASQADIVKLCQEAETYGFWSVCINPFWVPVASHLLAKTDTHVCSVVGFPLGATTTRVKALEAEEAIENGARELDVVINIGALKSGDLEGVREDIVSVVTVARTLPGIKVKVVLEAGLLSVDEKIVGCKLAQEAGADFVKTCTGFGSSKATVSDVALLRRSVPKTMGVKASGGINTYEDALRMIRAGANRLGTSAGVAVILGVPELASRKTTDVNPQLGGGGFHHDVKCSRSQD